MATFISFLLSNPTVLAILAALAAALGWGVKQRLDGAKAERAKQSARDLEAVKDRLEMDREATAAEREAARLSDEEARREALKWARR